MKIQVENVRKQFGSFTALHDVSLEIPSGKLVALLGPSGSGKTTLLRLIAGLDAPDAGRIFYGETDVTTQSARERNVGFVFQHYALFGHMTVFQNVAFGPQVRGWKKPQIAEKVRELLGLVRLDGLENRLPSQLSGGQRQRVALARALAANPQILMLDEPFGALDAKVRAELRRWIRELHDEIHLTSVFVTHDQEEAFEVADYVVVMSQGHIEQVGAPDELFAQPETAFVTDFLGRVNVFEGEIRDSRVVLDGDLSLPFSPQNGADSLVSGAKVSAFVRPHEFGISREKPQSDAAICATISRVNRSGATVKVSLLRETVAREIQPLEAEISHEQAQILNLTAQSRVWLQPQNVRVFPSSF